MRGLCGIGSLSTANGLTINGTSSPDILTYTPTGANDGTVARDGQNFVTTFAGVAGTFTLDSLGGSDTVVVVGTSAGDTIAVVRGGTTTVQVGAFKAVSLPTASVETLNVAAGPPAL